MFESMLHSDQCFVTLTYEDSKLPSGGNLQPVDAVLWLKRLRAAFRARLRFFLVGEYGEGTWRPHYHALLFGLPLSVPSEELVKKTWGKGHVQLGDVSEASIRYTCGYALKKLTKSGDLKLLGRVPEFVRMSRNPGIGHGFALELVNSLQKVTAVKFAPESGVPSVVMQGRKRMQLGKYLRQVIANESGLKLVSEDRREAYLLELFDLCQGEGIDSVEAAASDRQGCVNLETRERLFSSRRKL